MHASTLHILGLLLCYAEAKPNVYHGGLIGNVPWTRTVECPGPLWWLCLASHGGATLFM